MQVCHIELTKSVNDTNVVPGDMIKYTLKYKNTGNGECTGGGVEIQDLFDSNLKIIAYSMSVTGDTDSQSISFGYYDIPAFNNSTNTLTSNAHTVSPGEEGTIMIAAKILAPVQCGDFQISNFFKVWSNEEGWKNSNTVNVNVNNDCPPQPKCGDNVINQANETCDKGILNGNVCSPLYGSSCTYCSSQCKNVTLNGPYCGDHTCNGAENNCNCQTDCPGVCIQPHCGDGLVNQANETCDKGILNGNVCSPLYGSSCTYCSSQCKNVTLNGPYCGDHTCNGAENCSTCSSDCGVCPPITTCDLIDAHWSTSCALSGEVVTLMVHGINCEGKTIDFKVYQDECEGDKYITNTATAIFTSQDGHITSTWVAVAPSNGDTTPTYYFIAYVLGGSENIQSDNLDVTVKPTCGDGTCNNGETCSTCASDCGTCPTPEPECNINHFVQFCDVNWKCSGWNECVNGIMTRTCTDSNNCDTAYNKPAERSDCNSKVLSNVYVENESASAFWIILVVVLFVLLLIVIIYLLK